jgi:GT2 family glycosyltransferase
MTKKIIVSIIIVNYNGIKLLKTILQSIKKSSFKNYEILILDNDSSDGSRQFIKKNYKNVKLVVNKRNLGYSGINSALPYCKGKYILFLNNDMEIDKNCIKELLNIIEKDDQIGMAAPRLVNYYNKKLKSGGTWISRAFYNGHIAGDSKPKEIPYLGVGLIRKSIVNKFGYLFDKDYFIYAEDADLGMRLRLLGYKVVFAPQAILYHMHAVTTKKSKECKTTFLMERNLLMTFFKILSLKNILLFLPYVLFMRITALIRDIATLKFENAFLRIKAILWVIFNFNLISKKRKKLQKLRQADDRFILKVFSEKYLLKKPALI